MTRIRLVIFLLVILIFNGCENKDLPASATSLIDCSKSNLSVTVGKTVDASSCNLTDGSISVVAAGGSTPYVFSINGGSYQAGATFSNLGPGIYSITVQDANLCTKVISADLFATGSELDATVFLTSDSECLTNNGGVTVTGVAGAPPYTYQFGTGAFDDASNVQHNLSTGFYTITIRDSNGCPKMVNVFVPRSNTGVSYLNDIKPIVDKSCAITGCHNGDNGESRNWTVFSNFQKNAHNVKLRTGNKSMPLVGSLTDDEIKLIACWVDDGAANN